jgi:hypothetical protein
MGDYRILVTGWRDWPLSHRHVVWCILNTTVVEAPSGAAIVVVQGECPRGGVDLWAKQWAGDRGHRVEPHPADFAKGGRAAGPVRNTLMVGLGADMCLAFPGPGSRGTWDCVRKAVDADIPTRVFPWCTAFAAKAA